jgi:membrane protease YdiL (CAAX protease family)
VKDLLANRRVGALWRFAVSVAIWYCAEFLASAIASPLYRHHWRAFELLFRCAFLALLLGGLSLLIVAADRQQEGALAYMGLDRRLPWLRDLSIGTLVGCMMVGLAVAAIAIGGNLSFFLTVTPRAFGRLGLELVILLAAALAEEAAFRGYPFQRMIEAIGTVPAVIVLSALFGAVHWENPSSSNFSTLNTALVGAVLCVAYLRTRALWLPWGIHFGWNFALGIGFGLPVSGLTEFAVIIHGKAHGPIWLTGGAYGIEGSLIGTAVLLAGFSLVVLATRGRLPAAAPAPPVESASFISPTDNSSDRASNQ